MKSTLAAWSALSVLLTATLAAAQPSDPPPALLPPVFDLGPLADDDIGLVARIHFATHTPDFDRARAFYRQLGYTTGVSGFPLTNTHAMARALGMFDVCQYELVKGEVIALPGSLNTASIDLLQFKTPFDGRPPYEKPNHLGAAYSALLTTHLASDVEHLKSQGVRFLSEPYGVPGNRFVFFRDPDGVLFQLVETAPPHGDPAAKMHLVAMPFVAINVKDIEASLSFYAKFGYTDVRRFEHAGTLEEARAYGLDRPFRVRGADVALGRGDRHVLRLTQWLEPFDAEPANAAPINRIGIQRIALLAVDVDRAVAILKKQGVPFLSDIAPCCSGTGADESGIVHAIDPNGVYLELVGKIAPRSAKPQPEGCPPLEIKLPPKE
ncbi:MAG: VOC family protein [Deltaproteobacteria bacterium]|nr:VOC family protein [Deltaproteobacteria bacterium]